MTRASTPPETLRHPVDARRRPGFLCAILATLTLVSVTTAAHAHSRPWQVAATMRVEPTGVRYEIYTGFGLIHRTLTLARTAPDRLHVDEIESLQRQVAEHIDDLVSVEVDGQRVPANVQLVEITRDLSQPGADPESPTFDADTADVLIRVVHPTLDTPADVRVTWSLVPAAFFDEETNRMIARVNPMALLANIGMTSLGRFRRHIVVGPKPGTFTIDNENVTPPAPVDMTVATHTVTHHPHGVAWNAVVLAMIAAAVVALTLGFRRESHTLLALGCALGLAPVLAAATLAHTTRQTTPPAAQDAAAIARRLIANVYLAGMYTRESDIYDLLERSADGDYLDRLYRQLHPRQRDDGVSVQVLSVDVTDAQIAPRDPDDHTNADHPADAFRSRVRWTVRGLVRHANHVHVRNNAYDASFTVAPRDGVWKLIAGQPLAQARILDEVDPLP